MQKPDENGFVHITWPSKCVPHGGMFHTRVVEPNENQQQFVKLLLEESKLDIAQRRKSAYKLRQPDDERERQQHQAREQYCQRPIVRPRTSKRRSLSAIRESGIYEVEPYKPLDRGVDREHLKEMLAHVMQYGESPEQPPTRVPPPPPPKPDPASVLPTAKEQWHHLVEQIRERAEWLAEMEELGQAAPHRDVIHEQIGQRMRTLQALNLDGCVTDRSSLSGSGFSTMRSYEPATPGSRRSKGSGNKTDKIHSNRSSTSQEKQEKFSVKGSAKSITSKCSKQTKPSPKKVPVKDEHISALNQGKFTPLEHSPRRRV